jgi:hypothetical protein
MLDMATNSIVLAGIQPDANAVNTTVYLDTFDALGAKRTTTFRASQRALTLPHGRSSHASCWRESRGIQGRCQQSFARKPDSGAVHAMGKRGRPNCLQPE